MNSKLNLIFVFAVLMFGLVFLNSKIEAQESLISNTISVQNHTLLSFIQSQPWTLVEKLNEKEDEDEKQEEVHYLAEEVEVAVKPKNHIINSI